MEIKSTGISERASEICDWFRSGMPTTEIARKLSEEVGKTIAYQSVHRILKNNGLTRKDGGKHKQTSERREEQAKGKTQKLDDRYGCTEEQWAFLRAKAEAYKDTPLAAFNTFKNNFKNLYPLIPFNLNLWDWWTLWEQSGKWAQHKRNPLGMYVMTFIDRTKPMDLDNARVIAFHELLKEQRAPKPLVDDTVVDEQECEEATV